LTAAGFRWSSGRPNGIHCEASRTHRWLDDLPAHPGGVTRACEYSTAPSEGATTAVHIGVVVGAVDPIIFCVIARTPPRHGHARRRRKLCLWYLLAAWSGNNTHPSADQDGASGRTARRLWIVALLHMIGAWMIAAGNWFRPNVPNDGGNPQRHHELVLILALAGIHHAGRVAILTDGFAASNKLQLALTIIACVISIVALAGAHSAIVLLALTRSSSAPASDYYFDADRKLRRGRISRHSR
jgi:hypothetical protein